MQMQRLRDNKLYSDVLLYMSEHNTLTLATVAGQDPAAACLFYVNDDSLKLYFLSKPDSRHSKNLLQNSRVAVTISEDYHDWKMIKGIQLDGKAYVVNDTLEKGKILTLYLKKFPFVKDFFSQKYFSKVMFEISFYKIIPQVIRFTDNSGGFFGRKELIVSQ